MQVLEVSQRSRLQVLHIGNTKYRLGTGGTAVRYTRTVAMHIARTYSTRITVQLYSYRTDFTCKILDLLSSAIQIYYSPQVLPVLVGYCVQYGMRVRYQEYGSSRYGSVQPYMQYMVPVLPVPVVVHVYQLATSYDSLPVPQLCSIRSSYHTTGTTGSIQYR